NFGTAGTNTNISRNQGALMVFTAGGGAINFQNNNFSNDSSGILGGRAFIGNDYAALDGSKNVVADVAYTPIGAGAIVDGATTNNSVNTAPITNDGGNVVSVNSIGYVQNNIASSYTGGLTIQQGRFSTNRTTGWGAATNTVTVLPGGEAFVNNNNTNAQPFV